MNVQRNPSIPRAAAFIASATVTLALFSAVAALRLPAHTVTRPVVGTACQAPISGDQRCARQSQGESGQHVQPNGARALGSHAEWHAAAATTP